MRKKKLICILLTVLTLAVSLFPGGAGADEVQVCRNVRVKISTEEKSSISFAIIGNYYVAESPTFQVVPGSCTISVSGSSLKITNGGSSLVIGSKITLVRLATPYYNGAYLSIPNTRYDRDINYLGNMIFSRESSTSVRVINEVNIEEYLYGVVPYEISDSWPAEALKSQAVCARGYAVAAALNKPNNSYHLVDTSASQVYRGYNPAQSNSIAAVDATRGLVMTYGGKIITSYFAASNGGQTERSGNAWSTDLPYYVHKDDPFDLANPASPEELSFIPAEYTSANKKLMDELVLDMIQSEANSVAGKSCTLMNTVSVTPNTPKDEGDEVTRCFLKVDIVLTVLRRDDETPIDITITLLLNDLVYDADSNRDGIWNKDHEYRMRGAEVSTVEGQVGWQLTNRRFGHGVGMSQRGAQQRAADGQTFSEILLFYYDGVTLTTIDTAPETVPELPVLFVYPGRVVSVNDYVSVRMGPGSDYDSFARIDLGGLVLVTIQKYAGGSWHQVVYNGNLGYVSSKYVEILASTAYTTPGWVTLSDTSYYLDAEGRPHTGLSELDGKKYFFNSFGALQKGLIVSGDVLYYADATGVLQSGTVTINGFEYTFDPVSYTCPVDRFVALTTSSYTIDRTAGAVVGVRRGTSVDAFIASFSNPAGIMRIVDASGTAVAGERYVGTGMKVQTLLSGEVMDEAIVTIRGDANGDGYVDVGDILTIQSHILGLTDIGTGFEAEMANINDDEYIDVGDILLIIDDILGKAEIQP